MSVRFDTVKAGYVLYDVRRTKMGNTKMRRWGWWRVLVISVDQEKRTAMCSWNGNPARLCFPANFKRWRRSIPKSVAEAHGLATVTP